MYIYSVSIKLDNSIEQEWLQWMKNEHLDEVKNTGMFEGYSLLQLIEPTDEESKTYIAQYYTDAETRYNQYIQEFAPLLRQKGIDRFGEKFIAFRTILKKII